MQPQVHFLGDFVATPLVPWRKFASSPRIAGSGQPRLNRFLFLNTTVYIYIIYIYVLFAVREHMGHE